MKVNIVGYGVANFRSFDSEGFVLQNPGEINIIIGKNNSGKSNIIYALHVLYRWAHKQNVKFSNAIDLHHQTGHLPTVLVQVDTSSFVPEKVLSQFRDTLSAPLTCRFAAQPKANARILPKHSPIYNLPVASLKAILQGAHDLPKEKSTLQEMLANKMTAGILRAAEQEFRSLIHIPHFRQIAAGRTQPNEFQLDTSRVISELFELREHDVGEQEKGERFNLIQDMVRRLLNDRELTLRVPRTGDKILVKQKLLELPLDSLGTGLHELVILACALAMRDKSIVTIEEPELHMHPELQRRLLAFLKTTNNRYFISTHSNVLLDADPECHVYHVRHDGSRSLVEAADTTLRVRAILDDLSYKASDLLQCNGIVWVEGPSDRVYIKKWLELLGADFVEGIHYSIMFYGGRLLAHLQANEDGAGDDLVDMLRINRHAFVILDRDGEAPEAKVAPYKERIIKELGESRCWMTRGREIENYVRLEVIEKYISEQYDPKLSIAFGENDRLREALANAAKSAGVHVRDFSRNKVEFARGFVALMGVKDLGALDLKDRMRQLITAIKTWNLPNSSDCASGVP